MTVDPTRHLDPVGSLLPLLGLPFGWAKPVPVEPRRFREGISMQLGLLLVAAAGPASNLVIAAGVLAIQVLVAPLAHLSPLATRLLEYAIQLNIALAVFNLLPVPPLDGSRIVEGLIPFEHRARWDALKGPAGIAIAVLAVGWWLS